jgi:hypothetical protein
MSSQDSNLGPQPEPATEEPELRPGGADSIADEKYGDTPGEPTVPDIAPGENAAVEGRAPDEVTAPDDKQQAPDGASDQEAGVESDTTEEDVEPPV